MFRGVSQMIVWSFILISLTPEHGHSLRGEEAVKSFFNYFRVDDPLGIPVVEFEDPMALYSPLELVPLTLLEGKFLGHSRFKFKQVFLDFVGLTGMATVFCPRVEISGNYSWPGFLSTSQGFMNVTMWGVNVFSNLTFRVKGRDSIELTDIEFSQESEDVFLNLTELVWEHKAIMKTGAVHFFFDEIAAQVFKQLHPFLITEVNREVSKFIASIPPSRFLFTSAQKDGVDGQRDPSRTIALFLNKFLQYLGIDPLSLPDYSNEILNVKIKVTDFTLVGLSSISEIRTLFVVLQDNKIYLESQMKYPQFLVFFTAQIYHRLLGRFDSSHRTRLTNVVIHIRLTIDPSLRKSPTINHFDIDVEVLQERSAKGLFSAAIHSTVVDAVQGSLRRVLQAHLNKIDIEAELIHLIGKL